MSNIKEVTFGDFSFYLHNSIRESLAEAAFRELAINPIHGNADNLYITETKVGRNLKAIFIDDGIGITDRGFEKLSEIGNHIEGADNFGTGARVNTLKTNRSGVVFVSKRADGSIRNVKISLQDTGKAYPTAVAEYDLSEFKKDYGKDVGIEGTFTAVILLGTNGSQRTLQLPYPAEYGAEPFRPQAEHRFYDIPHKIYIKDVKSGKLKRVAGVKEQLTTAKYSETVTLENDKGVYSIHYHETRDTNIFGIVQAGEIYDCRRIGKADYLAKSGTSFVQKLGYADIRDDISLIVELHDGYDFVPVDGRDVLKDDRGHEINLNSFAKDIKAYTPDHFKALILQAQGDKVVNRDKGLKNEEALEDLLKLLDFKPKKIKDAIDGDLPPVGEKIVRKKPEPRPARVIHCPVCGFDITGLKGGETCPSCGKYTKPVRATPTPKPKHSKIDNGIPTVVIGAETQSYFEELDEKVSFVLVSGDSATFNVDHKAYAHLLEKARTAKGYTGTDTHNAQIGRAAIESFKDEITYCVINQLDAEQAEQVIFAVYPRIISDVVVARAELNIKGKK